MLIAEDLLLLLTDDDTGKLAASSTLVDIALGGALLVELALIERVDVAGPDERVPRGRLVVRDSGRTGDEVLNEALTMITSKEGKKPQTVVTALGKGTRGRLYKRLADGGVLRAEDGRVLGLFPTHHWPTKDASHEAAVRAALDTALLDGAATDARTGALIALLSALNVGPRGSGSEGGRALQAGVEHEREPDRGRRLGSRSCSLGHRQHDGGHHCSERVSRRRRRKQRLLGCGQLSKRPPTRGAAWPQPAQPAPGAPHPCRGLRRRPRHGLRAVPRRSRGRRPHSRPRSVWLPTGGADLGGPVVRLTGLRNPCAQINTFRPGLLKVVLSRADGTPTDERAPSTASPESATAPVNRKAVVMAVVERGGVVVPGQPITVPWTHPTRPSLPSRESRSSAGARTINGIACDGGALARPPFWQSVGSRAGRDPRAPRNVSDKQTERMASRVGEHVEGGVLHVSTVIQEPSAQLLSTLAVPLQILERRDLEVHVHLHRDYLGRPRWSRGACLLLNSHHSVAVVVKQDNPVRFVRAAVSWRLVPIPVMQPEELAIELGQASAVARVDCGVNQDGIVKNMTPPDWLAHST